MSKFIKSFDTTAELNAFLDGAESGFYLLRDNSDNTDSRIHYERVVNIPNFCVKAIEDSTVAFSRTDRNLQYSLDYGKTWVDYIGQTVSISTGAKMYWRRTVSTGFNNSIGKFTFTGNVALQGNIHSLLAIDFENLTSFQGWTGVFAETFISQTAITSIEKLRLPATTLQGGCYSNMFNQCSNITGAAPVLPATTLPSSCYQFIFYGTKINKITTYAEDISASYCLSSWLSGVPSTGDFYNLGGATYTTGGSGIPSGWTEHTQLPD